MHNQVRYQRATRSLIAAMGAGLLVTACFPSPAYFQADAQAAIESARKQQDARNITALEDARREVRAQPSSMRLARLFAQRLQTAYILGTVARAGLDGARLVDEVKQALEAALTSHPREVAEAHFSLGALYVAAGRRADAVIAYRASLRARPSVGAAAALASLVASTEGPVGVAAVCKVGRRAAVDDESLFDLLSVCFQYSGASTPEGGLAWAGERDIAFFKRTAQRRAREAALRRQREAEARARREAEHSELMRRSDEERQRRASADSRWGGRGGGGGASTYSLTLYNKCPRNVRLFLGQRPRFGSGTYTSMSGNSVRSFSGFQGNMIWIVDARDEGLSSFSPSGHQSIQILPSCSGFARY